MLNHILDFLIWQSGNFLSWGNLLFFVIGFLLIFGVFCSWYVMEEKKIILDSSFVKKFSLYSLWALIQQSLVLVPYHYWDVLPQVSYLFCLITFGILFHLPNLKLMFVTFMFGLVFYAFWFFFGFESLLYVAILHAFAGTMYSRMGYEMRVWRWNIEYDWKWTLPPWKSEKLSNT